MDRPAPAARALAVLAALASPVFLAGAVAAWVLKLWPANPLTLAAAAVAVLGGPLLALAHLATVRDPAPPPPAAPPKPAPAAKPNPAPLPPRPAGTMTPARARSLAFLAWRDHPPRPLRPLRSPARRRTVPAVRPEPKHDHLA